jgi:hypothetical protein
MRGFALGCIYAIPNVANPTPVPIASLKGCKVSVKQDKKKFRGNQRDVIDVGDGARDWDIDIDNADFRSAAFSLVAGGTTTVGSNLPNIGEVQTISAAAFTVTNSATFVEDGGVYDVTAQKFLTRVASAPAAGQYSGPAAGVYTCNAADNTHTVLVLYTNSSNTLGLKTAVSNAIQGASVAYKLRVYTPWQVGSNVRATGLEFYSVHFPELQFDWKVEDFSVKSIKAFASVDMIGVTGKTVDFFTSELG